jgi:hypothetical protein
LLKQHLSNSRLLDKARAAHRRACKRDPFLPPLLSVAGRVELNGAIRVVLPIVGGRAIYLAAPVGGWRFELAYLECSDAAAPAAPPAANAELDELVVQLQRVREMGDAALNMLADIERQICALEAKHTPINVVHFNNIAAE